VRNDVALGPPGRFLLVTGSNMSGKSTLLRAIGQNLALAFAGGPACAADLELSPFRLATSFRVRDSVAEGVSTFLAELRRLKSVVDAAQQAATDHAPAVLYLLDEILLGTNVLERQVAVQRVVGHLLKLPAIGAIATHDLSLAGADGIGPACQPVHFRESFTGEGESPRMTFDYRLRPGLSPTTNALKLLALVGLDDGNPPALPQGQPGG
jgi:DNA mismatch repair ATPase MutS